jgi:complex iron-sulfur molybdoenzyme family reductase subunit gamma
MLAHGLAVLAVLALPLAAAASDPLAAGTVQVARVPGPLAPDPAAPFWSGAAPLRIGVSPQRTVSLHDRKANEALAAAGPRAVTVRAAEDGTRLAVLLEWSDPTEDRTRPDSTDGHGDAVALQLPLRFGPGLRLPYVGMGDEGMKVAIHLQRAGADGTAVREGVASGFGTLERADLGGARAVMSHDRARGTWRAVLVRPLEAAGLDLRRGLVPFAVAVWDGARAERGGNKALSGWKLLRMPGLPVDAAYAAELAWGRRPGDLGDPVRGRALVQGMCIACHAVGALRVARPGLAPDLTGIGAIATPAYLRESIVDPGAVIVPGPNPAQHQDRTKAPGRTGAWPPNEGFAWSRRDPSGKSVSRMPAYAALPEQDLLAMVAYLATLGAAEGGAGGRP